MVRRHGWQLPAHTLQVAAITIFFLLAIAFYIFLAPFLCCKGLVIAAYAVYSLVAFLVFTFYVRCTAIDPGDPGVRNHEHRRKQNNTDLSALGGPLNIGSSLHPSDASSVASSVKGVENKVASLEEGKLQRQRRPRICSCAGLCGLLCGWMVAPDDCCDPPQSVVEEEMLFCTLCDTEVHRFSKHCRSCDKCVDGFDHHCRWLNNCIGKKNYKTFVALMSSTLMLLIVEGLVGTAVFVRCFVDRERVEEKVMDKLGNGFTRAPFASVVAVCTAVALLACIPLGELFFFHLILIKKGITTYEYVVAVRAQPRGSPVEDEVTSSSSGSTVPDMSRSSSRGLQRDGGWCTPPRIFVEHQDEPVPHPAPGSLRPEHHNILPKNKPGNVRISAWRLAKLNKAEATRAAESARKASSVLRPVPPPDLEVLNESDESYTGNSSQHSIASTEFGTPLERSQRNSDDVRSSLSMSPYKSELPRISTGREPEVIGVWSKSLEMDLKSSGSQMSSGSPLIDRRLADAASRFSATSAPSAPKPPEAYSTSETVDPSGSRVKVVAPPIGATLSDGYEASAGETTDDMRRPGKGRMMFLRESKLPAAGSMSGPGLDPRATSQFRGGTMASRTIQFRGRGISTSVLSAYQSRSSRTSVSSPLTSESDADLAQPDGGPHPATGSGVLSSQRFPSRNTGSLQNKPSVFFSGPLLAAGEAIQGSPSSSNQPRRPPLPLRSGIPGHPGHASSSRLPSRVIALPSPDLDPSDR